MNIIKKKWREITIFIVLVAICMLLYILVNHLLSVRQSVLFERDIAERKYNNILSGETSEEILENELKNIIAEKERLAALLPVDYRIQDATVDLVEIARNNKILNIEDREVNEYVGSEGELYKRTEIKIKDFYGSYKQVKDFIDYINNYNKKIVINGMEFEREEVTGNMNGKNLVLEVYSIN